MKNLKDLKKRILDISYKHHKAHISSSLIAIETIDQIYKKRKPNDPFILSSGCSGLAVFVTLEKYLHKDAEKLFLKYGTYPHYNLKDGMYCSSGSLGHGIGVAVGMALANKKRNVYCVVTDGECSEGSVWEAFRIATELKLRNLFIYIIANGTGAVKQIDTDRLEKQIRSYVDGPYPKITFVRTSCTLPHLGGVQGRYKIINEKEYQDILKAL